MRKNKLYLTDAVFFFFKNYLIKKENNMGEYLHRFDTETNFNKIYKGPQYYEPWVSYTDNIKRVDYNKRQLDGYLTFDVTSSGIINLDVVNNGPSISKTIEYCIDGDEWIPLEIDGSAPKKITVNSGDKVRFRGDNSSYANEENENISYITFSNTTCDFNLEGNIMSLVNSTKFIKTRTLTEDYTFYRLFEGCSGLKSAANLGLPAVTLTKYCYSHLFDNTGISEVPMLPALKLAEYCYEGMFSNCQSLVNVPTNYLMATELKEGCYQSMFQGCENLTTTLSLPARTSASHCYAHMFQGCTSLTTAPTLPATTLVDWCYYYMLSGCESLTQAPALPATTLAPHCYRSMFRNCVNLTQAPVLPATTIYEMSYGGMFAGCTSLTTAPDLPATTLIGGNCYGDMFKDCTSLVNVPSVLPATSLTSTSQCYINMFSNCTSLTTAPELPATELGEGCYWCMFMDCTSLTTAPELPATTLVELCYRNMFQGCSNLNYIKCLAVDKSATECTSGWMNYVPSTGTFVKAPSANWSRGVSGIPSGWTIQNA